MNKNKNLQIFNKKEVEVTNLKNNATATRRRAEALRKNLLRRKQQHRHQKEKTIFFHEDGSFF